MFKEKIKMTPLGGLNEIGKNITAFEYKNEIIIVDCGLTFPEEEMLGIDIVIPDFTYLEENKEKIKGIFITHGHEDHIGGLPYLMKKFTVPIYGTKLVLGLIGNKFKEHNIPKNLLHVIKPGDIIKKGHFKLEVIRSNHSIADAVMFAIETEVGTIVHTGDFKIDYTPLYGQAIDLTRLAEIGKKGVLLLMADSTNAERKGYTESEKKVGVAIENIFRDAPDRILVATFASNVHRVQKIIDAAVKFNKKVAISGRSMLNVVNVSVELGYLKIPKATLVDINTIQKLPGNEVVVITTGSQGEPMAALSRMAASEHKAVQIRNKDTVILSSHPIPGNEKTVNNIVNKLLSLGANVIYSDLADIHVSGHACQEELKLIHTLLKPRYFIPVHGEYRHMSKHAEIAKDLNLPGEEIFIMGNGQTFEFNRKEAAVLDTNIPCEGVLVDGLGVGDVGNIVLRDRKLLSEGGLIIVVVAIERGTRQVVSGPDIISRGFVYVRESEALMAASKSVVNKALIKCQDQGIREWSAIKQEIRKALNEYIYQQTKRNPVILPIIMEV